jgi:NTE family protein
MKELDRLGLLSQVDVLSAVSGGALPAASYALEGYRDFNFQNGFVERIGRDIQSAVAGPWYAAPQNLVRYAFRDMIPAEPVIRALDDQLFHGATFADLNPSRPILLLNATDALTGDPLVIAEEQLAPLGVPLAPFSIARAVYMSAAYPGVLEPLRLTDGRTGTNGAPASPVRTLIQVVESAVVTRSMGELFPQGCLVISIDATGRQKNETHRPLSAAAALLRGHRRNVLELAGIPASRQDAAQFGTFPIGREGAGGTCQFWHVALRQLPDRDPLGKRVTHITTNLGLSADDQTALIAAAARLVAKGREEMNGTAGWAGFMGSKPALFSHP